MLSATEGSQGFQLPPREGVTRALNPVATPLKQEMVLDDISTSSVSPPEEAGYTTKLQLSIPERFNVGVVCMPDIMRHFTLKRLEPLLNDNNESSNVDSNVESWRGIGIGRQEQVETRNFRAQERIIDTDCYFMLMENTLDNSVNIVPVSKYMMLEPMTSHKPGTSAPSSRSISKDTILAERLRRIIKSDDLGDVEENKQVSDASSRSSTKVKVEKIHWDYEEAASDDEEFYNDEVTYEDGDDPLNQPHLTLYGNRMKNLLQQQAEREMDEDLQEYSDDDEDSQVSSSGKQQRRQDSSDGQGAKKNKTEDNKSQTMEKRFMEFLRQNGGKVPIKRILDLFKITSKNDDFRIIHNLIQNRCNVSAEEVGNKKVKSISLKANYM